jgi:4,5-DOPA dioxygenase extradiol
MPVLFLGHGSPMNAILDNAYRRSWQVMGEYLLERYSRPQLILCVSAHWLTKGWYLTAMEHPITIHDFSGFPQALHQQQYPAPGSPEAAADIASQMNAAISHDEHKHGGKQLGYISLDRSEWGLDHGAWGVLKPMFPKADIPVIQLSLDANAHPTQHFELGQHLRSLRDQGVLIVGSGNSVHNLGMMNRSNLNADGESTHEPFDWALQFDHFVRDCIDQGYLGKLAQFQESGEALKALAKMAHPSYEHYLPLLHAAGAVDGQDAHRYFNEDFDMGAISMRSIIWEPKSA